MIGREADGVEGEDGVQHRRLDAAPLPVLVLMAEDPLDGARHGTAAERLPRAPADDVERPIDGEEEVPDRGELPRARESEVGRRRRAKPELGDGRFRADVGVRPVRHQERQRYDRAARPARHGVDVDGEPRRQEHELDGHRRDASPGELPEVGEPDAREDARTREPALTDDEITGASQRRLGPFHARQLQGEVCLNRGAKLGWAAGVVVPAAVGHLLGEEVAGDLDGGSFALAAQEGHQQDVLGLEDRIALELRDPVSLLGLLRQQPVSRPRQGRFHQVLGVGRPSRPAPSADRGRRHHLSRRHDPGGRYRGRQGGGHRGQRLADQVGAFRGHRDVEEQLPTPASE